MIVLSQFAQHQKNGQILALVQMTSVNYYNNFMSEMKGITHDLYFAAQANASLGFEGIAESAMCVKIIRFPRQTHFLVKAFLTPSSGMVATASVDIFPDHINLLNLKD